jgi:hypothetical protein
MPRKHSKTSAARVTRSTNAGRALELRKAGLTFRQIGQRMGFTEQRAHKLVTEELARLNSKRSEAAEAVTRLEVERLDALLRVVYPKALKGDMQAFDRVLAVMARRAKMLGIDRERGVFGDIIMQANVTQPTVALNPEQRRDMVRAILVAATRTDGPKSEAAELLAMTDAHEAGQDIEAGPPPNGEAAYHRLVYGLKEMPLVTLSPENAERSLAAPVPEESAPSMPAPPSTDDVDPI